MRQRIACLVACVWLCGCATRQSLRDVRQDPAHQRALALHQHFSALALPKPCQEGCFKRMWPTKLKHFKRAREQYQRLIASGAGKLSGALARCRLGDLYAELTAFYFQFPIPPEKQILKKVIKQVRKVLYKRRIPGRYHYRVLRTYRMRRAIRGIVRKVKKKLQRQIYQRARPFEDKAQRLYVRCLEDSQPYDGMEVHRGRAKAFLDGLKS